ncbi:MAG TPA: hypothetical protein VD969_19925 [Symbiobacteriaceae bacterium]|nr:hypothetical protein [Symbiobacteriaceae bacterium]
MEKIVFCSMATCDESLAEVRTLLASLRAFGGEMAQSPFWIMVPESDPGLRALALDDPCVRVVPFSWEPGEASFPFTRKLAAGAAAEALLAGAAGLVAWMAPETLILQDPQAFLLDAGKAVAGRPVDVMLIGPKWDEPLDAFWSGIFGSDAIPAERFVRLESSVGRVPLRNHFNSGLLVVRPDRGLLRAWWADFLRLFRQPVFTQYYLQGENYELLMHQAVLAGTILRWTRPEEVAVLPDLVSYPLHLHADYPAEMRPHWLDEVTTARYYLEYDPGCLRRPPAREPLKSWLEEHLP